jgi:hypothetical protein
MEREPRTLEEIQSTIRAARDSVWVITDQIEKLAAGETPDTNIQGNIERNVSHLELVVADTKIVNSGENISDLVAAIASGREKLAENIWPTQG